LGTASTKASWRTRRWSGWTRRRVAGKPVSIIADEVVRALLKAVSGTSFDDRRDLAMLRVWLDTGVRRAAMASITVNNLNLSTTASA
jgi:site-specific recombinase XerD